MAEDWGYQSDLDVIDGLVDVRNRFVVDAGCGAGQLCFALAERGARVLGIEPDPVQSEKNDQMATVANVGFARAGAAEIPVESGSVDGVVFSNSLHHVPQAHYPQVFEEIMRILRRDGFLYVIEPIANGTSQYVMELFHDETNVRLAAYRALVDLAGPRFQHMREIYYDVEYFYRDFNEFANHYSALSYNRYQSESVRSDEVLKRFEQQQNRDGTFTLVQPMRANFYTQPRL
ncbi:MAG: class I SAM-dependent methyltransferase [Pseudomonadota bacterium]